MAADTRRSELSANRDHKPSKNAFGNQTMSLAESCIGVDRRPSAVSLHSFGRRKESK